MESVFISINIWKFWTINIQYKIYIMVPQSLWFFLGEYWVRYAINYFTLFRFSVLVSSMFVLVLQVAQSNTVSSWISSWGTLRFFTIYLWGTSNLHVIYQFFGSLFFSQIHIPESLEGFVWLIGIGSPAVILT